MVVSRSDNLRLLSYLTYRLCRYDEDRWPSGSAGGLVTKESPQFAAKQLLFTPVAYGAYGRLPKHFE